MIALITTSIVVGVEIIAVVLIMLIVSMKWGSLMDRLRMIHS